MIRVGCGSVKAEEALPFLLYHPFVPTIHVVAKRFRHGLVERIVMVARVSRVHRWAADWFAIAADGALPRILVI